MQKDGKVYVNECGLLGGECGRASESESGNLSESESEESGGKQVGGT